ncbi:23S rRNA pseudouridine(1911/1915/1917) synthase RluD [Agitococcus lubricus]|uniref:Pseudouridine synthase n=1 Tax=Agitococcus lubricus TaxID=1077255 RepID=A0A2T5J1E0_9GAMM|nr:23S rRNA pseudouridine(1911/1915/1917) synthase RluD [Agitococcus lubricus]PTQ90164.1 ribosomal large subunit pseudouridine synthase D [Agitococcus lubricus]
MTTQLQQSSSENTDFLTVMIPADLGGARLDQAAARLFSDYSRERLKEWIQQGHLLVDGKVLRPKDRIVGGEYLTLQVVLEVETEAQAQEMPLNILYEDDHILVLDKPAGLVVHPGAGNPDGTLLNALLHHCPDLKNIPRAGLVHRIDKDTSGLLVVAKTLPAQTYLVAELSEKNVYREYEAVVQGLLVSGGTIDAPIARHPHERVKMAVLNGGKPAVTHYRVIKRYRSHTHVRVELETGRTHQIRVHFAHKGYPLLGDPVYAGRPRLPKGASPELVSALQQFPRQALHARRLSLVHPDTGEQMSFESPLPQDLIDLLACLNQDVKTS